MKWLFVWVFSWLSLICFWIVIGAPGIDEAIGTPPLFIRIFALVLFPIPASMIRVVLKKDYGHD